MIKVLLNILGRRVKSEVIDFLAEHVPVVQDHKSTKLALAGSIMSDDEASYLEARIADNPADLDSRIKLLGKYSREQYYGGPAKQLRLQHIEWIIVNRPDHVIAGQPWTEVEQHSYEEDYPRFKSLWLKKVEEQNHNIAVLINAASFFDLDDNELAERFLLQALKIVPNDRAVRNQLAHLYSLWDGHEEQALAQIEMLCNGKDSEASFYDLSSVPAMAFEAGQYDRAFAASNTLLLLSKKYRKSQSYGGAINEAHTILGRLALGSGDVEKAKHHLAQSILGIASPIMLSFGPSLDLAKELVKAGEKTCVLEYLDKRELLCGVGHPRAFEVRYEAVNGIERDQGNLEDDERFDEAFLEHQIQVLGAREPAQRLQHLKDAIQSTRSSLKIWSRRPEQAVQNGSEGARLHAEHKVKIYEQHLRRLEVLV